MAIKAALKGKLINGIITNELCAEALLKQISFNFIFQRDSKIIYLFVATLNLPTAQLTKLLAVAAALSNPLKSSVVNG